MKTPPTLASQVCTVEEALDKAVCSRTPRRENINENPRTKNTLTKNTSHLFLDPIKESG